MLQDKLSRVYTCIAQRSYGGLTVFLSESHTRNIYGIQSHQVQLKLNMLIFNNTTTESSFNGTENECVDENRWWVLITSIIIYIAGILLSIIVSICIWLESKREERLVFATRSQTLLVKLKRQSRQLISGDTLLSRLLLIANFICNLAFIGIAVYRTTLPIVRCFSFPPADIIVEALLSIILFVFTVVRLFAAGSIILFWFSLYTVVDVLTLPNVFVALGLGQDWLGLKILRFIWLVTVSDILSFTPFIRSQDSIDILSLLVRFVTFWLTAAGIVHLLEASGDPWGGFQNAQDVTFPELIYFVMVTMSTVGYGDYFPETTAGKIFITFFILAGLAFFAITLPAFIDIAVRFYRRTQYSKFDTRRVPQHVVVCGHITASSAEEFLSDFLHEDHGDKHTHVLFLHPNHPEQNLRTVLRSYYTRVQYIVGSVLNGHDLSRAKIHHAKACFIIADKHSHYPAEEDNGNLLRLVSIKNTTDKIPVIIQVLRSISKEQISNIPGWVDYRDSTVCLSELKLGLLAQSCMCPGLSTLIANLFYTCGDSKVSQDWQNLYLHGASNELYPSRFSPSFHGMSFYQAAKECYKHLGLILVAIQKDMSHQWYVSPAPAAHQKLVINNTVLGYFIGPDASRVQLVSHYSKTFRDFSKRRVSVDAILGQPRIQWTGHLCPTEVFAFMVAPGSPEPAAIHVQNTCYSHYPHQALTPRILDEDMPLNSHIVLCLFANEQSPIIGLKNFLEPLRSQSIPREQIKTVVIITNRVFLEKEWELINIFSDIYLVFGSPLSWALLTKARIETCSVCVILTAIVGSSGTEHAIDDKEAVLCSLSIQSQIGGKVMIITDLIQESNVQFLDISDEDELEERVYKSQPFACGEAFATSMFDSVTTSAFHSPGTLYLVENLIGCSSKRSTGQSRIVATPLSSPEYSHFVDATFSDLYTDLLSQSAICLAIYRQLKEGSSKHYVITAPPADTVLQSTDIAFVLTEWVPPSIAIF